MNRTLPPARYRPKPESAFLENLIDPIDRLTESLFSILILLTFTMASWIIGLSGSSEQSPDSRMTVDLALAALLTVTAYGVIDGVIYALLTMFGRGESHRVAGVLRILHLGRSGHEQHLGPQLDPDPIRDDLHQLAGPGLAQLPGGVDGNDGGQGPHSEPG